MAVCLSLSANILEVSAMSVNFGRLWTFNVKTANREATCKLFCTFPFKISKTHEKNLFIENDSEQAEINRTGGACHLDLHAGKLWGFTSTINLSISNILSRWSWRIVYSSREPITVFLISSHINSPCTSFLPRVFVAKIQQGAEKVPQRSQSTVR